MSLQHLPLYCLFFLLACQTSVKSNPRTKITSLAKTDSEPEGCSFRVYYTFPNMQAQTAFSDQYLKDTSLEKIPNPHFDMEVIRVFSVPSKQAEEITAKLQELLTTKEASFSPEVAGFDTSDRPRNLDHTGLMMLPKEGSVFQQVNATAYGLVDSYNKDVFKSETLKVPPKFRPATYLPALTLANPMQLKFLGNLGEAAKSRREAAREEVNALIRARPSKHALSMLVSPCL